MSGSTDRQQSIQAGFAEMALIDLPAEHGLAGAIGGQCRELTWAAGITIAIGDMGFLNAPVGNCHRCISHFVRFRSLCAVPTIGHASGTELLWTFAGYRRALSPDPKGDFSLGGRSRSCSAGRSEASL